MSAGLVSGDAGIDALLPADHVRPQRRGGALLRVFVPVAMVAAMLAASVGTTVWSYRTNRNEALALADQILAGLEQRIHLQVEAFLAPAADLARLSSDLLGPDALSAERRAATRGYAFSVLRNNPQVALVTFGGPRGDFLMFARQADDGAVDTKHIDRSGETARVTWTRRDPGGEVISVTESADDGYDPRTRPWYQGAVESGALYWSDVYVFFTSRQPGLTVSVPVRDAAGNLAAVHGLDITLDSLSDFLSGLEIGVGGQALVVGPGAALIAFPDVQRMVRADGDRLRTATVDELGDPVLARAYNRFRVEGQGRRVLEVAGRRYLNTVSSLKSVLGREWSVMIVVPEDDYVGSVRRNFGAQLAVDSVIVLIAMVLAGLVLTQGVRARRNARRVEERERVSARQRQALAAVATEARLFDADDTASLAHLSETLAAALEVDRVSVWRLRAGDSTLVCEDAYDRRADGHTRGAELKPSVLGDLLQTLVAGDATAITDSARDPLTHTLHRAYLEPLGCRTLLSAPVIHDARCRGALWVEDGPRSSEWTSQSLPFVSGVANLLALRWVDAAEQAPSTAGDAPGRGVSNSAEPVSPALAAALRSTSLTSLAAARGEETRRRAQHDGGLAADLFETVTVLVLVMADPRQWATRAAGAGDDENVSCADTLVRHVEVHAALLGVECVKVLGGEIVCAAGFDAAPGDGADAIASLARSIQGHCTEALGGLDNPLAYRMGIDTGPVFGGGLGGGEWTYDLWGEALGRARDLASTAAPGSIQVSDASFELLADDHLFATGGHYFVAGSGETVTYLLLGHI